MRIGATAFVGLVSGLVMVGCQPDIQGTLTLPEGDAAAIRSTINEFIQAELAGDWDRAFEFFAENVVCPAPDQPEIQGLPAFRRYVESLDFFRSYVSLNLEFLRLSGSGLHRHR